MLRGLSNESSNVGDERSNGISISVAVCVTFSEPVCESKCVADDEPKRLSNNSAYILSDVITHVITHHVAAHCSDSGAEHCCSNSGSDSGAEHCCSNSGADSGAEYGAEYGGANSGTEHVTAHCSADSGSEHGDLNRDLLLRQRSACKVLVHCSRKRG